MYKLLFWLLFKLCEIPLGVSDVASQVIITENGWGKNWCCYFWIRDSLFAFIHYSFFTEVNMLFCCLRRKRWYLTTKLAYNGVSIYNIIHNLHDHAHCLTRVAKWFSNFIYVAGPNLRSKPSLVNLYLVLSLQPYTTVKGTWTRFMIKKKCFYVLCRIWFTGAF